MKKLTKKELLNRIAKIQKEINSKHSQLSKDTKYLTEKFGIAGIPKTKRREATNRFIVYFTKLEKEIVDKIRGELEINQYIKTLIKKEIKNYIQKSSILKDKTD